MPTYSNLLLQSRVQQLQRLQASDWIQRHSDSCPANAGSLAKPLVEAWLQSGLNRAAVTQGTEKWLQFSCLISVTLLPGSLVLLC